MGMKLKLKRNLKIVAQRDAGMTLVEIARRHKISWARVARIIKEQGARS